MIFADICAGISAATVAWGSSDGALPSTPNSRASPPPSSSITIPTPPITAT